MEEEEEVVGQTNDDVAGMENITIREAMNIFFLRTEIQYDEMGGMCDWCDVMDAMGETRISYRNLDGKWCKGFNLMPCFNIYLERMRKKTTNPAMNLADLESSGHILAFRSVVPRRQRANSSLYPYKSINLFGMY